MLRGINVGGRRPLKMETLRLLCEELGFLGIETHLCSGNVVCRVAHATAEEAGKALEGRVADTCGFEADVLARTAAQMGEAVRANPLAALAGVEDRFLHATFLARRPDAALVEKDLPRARGERAVLLGRTVYLYCPGGYGITKLNNAFLERKLGVRSTTRNWRTVCALAHMGARAG